MIGQDKIKHIAVGFVISLFATAAAIYFGYSPWLGLVAASVIGAGKEILDDHGPGHEDFMDFFATLAGGCVPPILCELINSLIL
jgi:hypothetical protein